jgi:DNA-binding NtrC family response regulator
MMTESLNSWCDVAPSDQGKSQYVDRKPELLVADVDERTRTLCRHIAEELDCNLLIASDGDSVLTTIQHADPSVVLLDATAVRAPLDLVADIKTKSVRIEVILIEENATTAAAVRAIKAGFSDYLEKPLDIEPLERAIKEALERHRNFQPSIPTLEQLERQAIQQAMAQAEGDKIEAARLLSIGKTTLYRKLRQYGDYTRRRRGPARRTA